jgi:hypothetical protein
MVFDGSCGHRPMIWRPSDMVSIRSYRRSVMMAFVRVVRGRVFLRDGDCKNHGR